MILVAENRQVRRAAALFTFASIIGFGIADTNPHDPTIAQLARYWSTLGKRFGEAQGTTSKPVVAQLIERLAVKYSAM
jgi:hypothetical protein